MRMRDEIEALKMAAKVASATSEADAIIIQAMRDEIERLRGALTEARSQIKHLYGKTPVLQRIDAALAGNKP